MRTQQEQQIMYEIESILKTFKNVVINVIDLSDKIYGQQGRQDFKTKVENDNDTVIITLVADGYSINWDEWATALAKFYTIQSQIEKEYLHAIESPNFIYALNTKIRAYKKEILKPKD
jgi:hypothetical protein